MADSKQTSTPPAQPEQSAWSSRSLAGKWRHHFFYILLRLFGLNVTKLPLFFVVLTYALRPSIAARAKHYLRRRFSGKKAAGFCNTFRLYWMFGTIVLERAAAGILKKYSITSEAGAHETLNSLLAKGKGLIILSAHVGAWQTAVAGLHFGTRINILQPRGHGDIDLHVFEHGGEQRDRYRLIDPEKAFGGFVEARAALQAGEIVCIMGDRLMPDEKLAIGSPFLGEEALFPGSLFLLAAVTGAPVAVVFTRRSGSCAASCECLATILVPPSTGKRQNDLEPFVATFAAALESFCQREPYQFFNFHNLWKTEE
jgi:predicted LPLAT superfamily acyltransferase